MSKIIIEEEVATNKTVNEPYKRSEGKTSCRDEPTCNILNDFLDEGYKRPDWIGFTVESLSHNISLTIGVSNMGPVEKMELSARIMNFMATEMENIKNGN